MPEEGKTSFSFSASPSLIAGSGFEYVLEYDVTKSRLDWPLLPAGGLAANAEFKLKKGLYLSFFSSFIIPSYSGQMFDYDYLNSSDPSMLTHFSEHKSYIRQGMDFSFNLGWVKPIIVYKTSANKKIKIHCGPSLGIRYILNSWAAIDGYLKYPPNTNPPSPVLPDTPIVPQSGIGVTYKQSFILPSIGILFRFELPEEWKLDLFTQLCSNPLGEAEDIHYKRSLKFKDIFKTKSFSFYLYFSTEKRFSKYFSFFSSIDYTAIVAYNGKTFQYQVSSFGNPDILLNTYNTGSAGSVLHSAHLNLGIGFHLGK